MKELERRILDRVRDVLGADSLAGAVVYLDWNPIRAGERLEVGDAVIQVPWDAHIAFIDLEPRANWGHACSYLAIRLDGDEVIQVAAQMPPFLKAKASTFHLLWRGPLVPGWAIAANPD